MKQLLIVTVEIFDYIDINPIDVMNHFYSAYGYINDFQLTKNDKIVRSLYDVTQPFESWAAQVEYGVDFATVGSTPYTPQKRFSIA